MITMDNVQIGGVYLHRSLGPVRYTAMCAALQAKNPDPTSIFVDDFGEILEVSLACLEDRRARATPDAPE